jgi:site-specific recombinase XerD
VHSYRDTFRLLIRYVAAVQHQKPTQLRLADLSAPVIVGFLDHLENDRGNSIPTRNIRLAAIHSFMHFVSYHTAIQLPMVGRVLALPMKLCHRGPVDHLSTTEIRALLNSADRTTRTGQRDWILLQTLYNTGIRVSELIAVRIADINLGSTPRMHIHGKGRKDRVVPLWPLTATAIQDWIRQRPLTPQQPLVPGRDGHALSRSGVASRLDILAARARPKCPSLSRHHISPHLIRHTTAMHLLQSGVDLSVIALWLGHESIQTTHQYMEADLELKRNALESIEPATVTPRRFQADDPLLHFLETL